MIKKRFVFLLFILFIFLFSCYDKPSSEVGSYAKDFQLDTITHQRFYLNQQKGKNVILIFWATWCSICKEEIIQMQEFLSNKNFQNINLVTICIDPENFNEIKKIKEGLNLNSTILLDKGQKVSEKYGVQSIPVTFIIDRSGKIFFKETGHNAVIFNRIKNKIIDLLDTEINEK